MFHVTNFLVNEHADNEFNFAPVIEQCQKLSKTIETIKEEK